MIQWLRARTTLAEDLAQLLTLTRSSSQQSIPPVPGAGMPSGLHGLLYAYYADKLM